MPRTRNEGRVHSGGVSRRVNPRSRCTGLSQVPPDMSATVRWSALAQRPTRIRGSARAVPVFVACSVQVVRVGVARCPHAATRNRSSAVRRHGTPRRRKFRLLAPWENRRFLTGSRSGQRPPCLVCGWTAVSVLELVFLAGFVGSGGRRPRPADEDPAIIPFEVPSGVGGRAKIQLASHNPKTLDSCRASP